jgi:hypothetical protein
MTWAEAEYLDLLRSERRAYAWVLRRHGGMSLPKSWAAALDCYPYEPADEPYRGLVFHDEAWHWAMLWINGHDYVTRHPDLAEPPAEYLALG